MRIFNLFILVGLVSFQTSALTLKELSGQYKVTSDMVPVVNAVSIAEDGTVILEEMSPRGVLKCEGNASLIKEVLTSEMTCENGGRFTQKIKLTGVTDLNTFKALVYSSLYDAELEMNFKKIH